MQPQRLPIVDSDDGVWGDIIRQYLMKEHYNDDTNNAANGGHQKVTIRAGTTTSAPLKLTSGSLLTTPQAGAIEFLGDSFYATQTTSATRKKLAIYDDSAGATGDLYFRNSSGYFARLGIGSAGDYLAVVSGVPAWTSQIVGKTLDSTNTVTLKDSNFTLQHTSDATKQARFQLSGITAGTVRAYTLPDATSVLLNDVSNQNISGIKTFQSMMYAREIWVTPTNGSGNTAALSLDNQNGQVWQNTNNSGGSWALWDQTHSKAPILVQPNSPDQAIVVDSSGVYVDDSYFTIVNLADPTKQAKFEVSGITTNTARTYTFPNANMTIVGDTTTQALTNKTIDGANNTITNIPLATGVSGALPVANGGTGQTTQQAAINALTGTQVSGRYLRSNGTNASLSAIVAADVPTLNQNTTGSAATLTTARTVQTNLASTSSASFNGSANITPGVTGNLAVTNGGTGRNGSGTAYGIIAAGATVSATQTTIAPGTAGQFMKSQGNLNWPVFANITYADISGGGAPYDVSFMHSVGTRATGYGGNAMGTRLARNCTFTSVTFRCATADASGNLVVELRKNGAAVTGTSTTIAAASQVSGGTSTGSWSFSVGDILTVYITSVGTTPGTGLVADITGVTA